MDPQRPSLFGDTDTMPVPGVALDDPATVAAFRDYRVRARWFAVAGLVALLAATAAVAGSETHNFVQNIIGVYGYGGGPVLLGIGVGGLVRSRRTRRLLRVTRWDLHPVRTGRSGSGTGLVVGDVHPDDAVYLLSGIRQRVDRFAGADHDRVLLAGFPGRWVVVTPPDRSMVVLARRPRSAWARRQTRRAATAVPLTPEAQAQRIREVKIFFFAIVFGTMVLSYTYLFFGWPVGLPLAALAGAAIARTIRRWGRLPRQGPQPTDVP
jgi:hypothetical protein